METKGSNTKYLFYVICLVIILILLTVAITYAFFRVNTSKSSTLSSIEAAMECIDIEFYGGGQFGLGYKYPITDSLALNNLEPATFTIINNCANNLNSIPYTLILTTMSSDNDPNSNFIDDGAIRLKVDKRIGEDPFVTIKEPGYLNDLNSLAYGHTYDFLMNEISYAYNIKNPYILDESWISNNSVITYDVYVWVDYYEGDRTMSGLYNNSTEGSNFYASINVIVNSD